MEEHIPTTNTAQITLSVTEFGQVVLMNDAPVVTPEGMTYATFTATGASVAIALLLTPEQALTLGEQFLAAGRDGQRRQKIEAKNKQ